MGQIRKAFFDYHGTVADPIGLPPEEEIMHRAFSSLPDCIYEEVMERYQQVRSEHAEGKLIPRLSEALYEQVLDGDESLIARYTETASRAIPLAKNLKSALRYLEENDIGSDIITKASTSKGAVMDQMFVTLILNDIADFFGMVYTPSGIYSPRGEVLSEIAPGEDKEEIYPLIIEHLKDDGLEPKQAVMIGNDPKRDVQWPKEHGLWTVQYAESPTDFWIRGDARDPSDTDYLMTDFLFLREIIEDISANSKAA